MKNCDFKELVSLVNKVNIHLAKDFKIEVSEEDGLKLDGFKVEAEKIEEEWFWKVNTYRFPTSKDVVRYLAVRNFDSFFSRLPLNGVEIGDIVIMKDNKVGKVVGIKENGIEVDLSFNENAPNVILVNESLRKFVICGTEWRIDNI